MTQKCFMMKLGVTKWTCILLAIVQFAGCKTDNNAFSEDESTSGIKSELKGALLRIAYDITTTQWYECDYEKLTELDIAHCNPSEEKQQIVMYLMSDGTANMTVEELDFERTIHIQHEITPSDLPKIKRTEIIGGIATYYDGNRNIIGSQPVEMTRQKELADQIQQFGSRLDKDAARCFATMQSVIYDHELEKLISDARASGRLIDHNKWFATVRTNLSDVQPGATGASVVLIDMNIKRVVATTIYDEKDNLIMRTYYGYEKEGVPILNVTRTETLLELPSGAEVMQITQSKFTNHDFNLNNKTSIK